MDIDTLWKFVFNEISDEERRNIFEEVSKEQMYLELVSELEKMKKKYKEEIKLKKELQRIKLTILSNVFQ